jgi:hypothetical protein
VNAAVTRAAANRECPEMDLRPRRQHGRCDTQVLMIVSLKSLGSTATVQRRIDCLGDRAKIVPMMLA